MIRHEGEFWTLSFGGRTVHLKDSKGLRYLACLMESPGKETHALDLVGSGLAASAMPDATDAQSRAAYTARLRGLDRDIDDAELIGDQGALERSRAERDAIVSQLRSVYGLGGRVRRSAGDPAERARKAVTERIRTTLTRIERVHPALGRHLRSSVRTGMFCSYTPGPEPEVAAIAPGVRVVLVDDHPLWRQTLRQVLEHEHAATVIGEASEGGEAVGLATRLRPDVVVMDMALPGMTGADATRAILAAWPEAKVLVLSSSDERDSVLGAVAAGASGYVLKTADATQIGDAVRRVHAGELVVPAALSRIVLGELRR